jgi:hypothetical protein
MAFGSPSVLWFLFLASIPILIHLFRFRRYKKTLFTRVDLLKDIVVQTGFGNKLRKWLLLALRTLALLFLILSFARPFIPTQGLADKGLDTVLIFLDNSLSMTGDGAEGPLFEAAKNRARAFVEASDKSKSFLLLSHATERDASQLLDKQEVLQEIDRLQIEPVAKPDAEWLDQLLFLENKSVITALISDFRKGTLSGFEGKRTNASKHYWLPVPAKASQNLAIDSVWFESPQVLPGQSVQLGFRVANTGTEDQNDITIRLKEQNQFKGSVLASVDANKKANYSITFKAGEMGWKNAQLELPGDDFSFDDIFYFSYRVQKGSKGLVLHSEPNSSFLTAFFASGNEFDVVFQSPLQTNFAYLSSCDFVILDGVLEPNPGLELELKKFVSAGGNLFFIPSAIKEPASWNTFLTSIGAGAFSELVSSPVDAAMWDNKNPLLSGVFEKIPSNPDLPKIELSYAYKLGPQQLPLWKLKNDKPIVLQSRMEAGSVFVFTVALDKRYGNLARHPLFVPFLHRLVSYKKADSKLFYHTGLAGLVALPTDVQWSPSETYSLSGQGSEWRAGIQLRAQKPYLNLHGELRTPGFYQLNGQDKELLFAMACNLNSQESMGTIEAEKDMQASALSFGASLNYAAPNVLQAGLAADWNGKSLAHYFLLLTLIFLIAEMILIRLWKM